MKKIVIGLIFLCLCGAKLIAQVGVSTNSPHKSAALDMSNQSNKGLLIPNVALSNTSIGTFVNGGAPAQGLMVYNTNGTVGGTGAAGTGYYYWDVDIWKKVATKDLIPAVVGTNTVTSPNSTINVGGASNTVLGATSVDIKPGAANTVMTTNASANGVVWVAPSTLTTAPATEWYLGGGTTDAGSNKTGAIHRTGRVGLGTNAQNPATLLDINNGSTNGAIKIVDGTQGDGRVLTSDVNGVATWQTKGPQTTPGDVENTGDVSYSSTSLQYIKYSIPVPPGRSTVTAGLIVIPGGDGYVTCRLLPTTTSSTQEDPAVIVVPKYSGFTVVNSTSTGQVMWYVNNTTTTSKTLYVWMVAGGGAKGPNYTVGGKNGWGEAFIMDAF